MSTALKNSRPAAVVDRPGWIPAEITHDWDTNPYAYQTEEEQMPGGGLHSQLLAYLMEVLRPVLKRRGLKLLMDTFLLYRDSQGIKQRIAPDLLLMPWRQPPPSAYDLDVEPPPACVLEVTSAKSHARDKRQKVAFYASLGITTYVVIDAITPGDWPRECIALYGWQTRGGQAQPMIPAADGSLPLTTMGLRIRTEQQRILFIDEATGRLLQDGDTWLEALDETQQALAAERQARLQLQTAYQAEAAARQAEAAARQTEAAARQAAEAEVARLRALLAQKT